MQIDFWDEVSWVCRQKWEIALCIIYERSPGKTSEYPSRREISRCFGLNMFYSIEKSMIGRSMNVL